MEKNYYQLSNGAQAIDVCRDLNFNLGNVVKYIVRAGRKVYTGKTAQESRIADLRKALDYLNDEIERSAPKQHISEPIDLFADDTAAPVAVRTAVPAKRETKERKRGHSIEVYNDVLCVARYRSLREAEAMMPNLGLNISDTTIYRATLDGRSIQGYRFKSVPKDFTTAR